jgi:3'-phosphoadenosine 5'-phosphosulfate sulfotransferase (PAPS reductase)/FAD synthetase
MGMQDAHNRMMANIPEKDRSMFSQEKWKFLLDAPFDVSHLCCNVMKKAPSHGYSKRTGRMVMTAQMACESRLRTQQWLRNGCNGFDLKIPTSNPMAFWTEQDVLNYIKQNGRDMVERRIEALEKAYGCPLEEIIDPKTGKPKFDRNEMTPICSVYGDIVIDANKEKQLEGQTSLADILPFDMDRPLKTTGCSRTGCMFCGFGCHLEKEGEGRFEMMKKTHPKQYDYIMRPKEQGGLNYKEVIDWINEHGNTNIRY